MITNVIVADIPDLKSIKGNTKYCLEKPTQYIRVEGDQYVTDGVIAILNQQIAERILKRMSFPACFTRVLSASKVEALIPKSDDVFATPAWIQAWLISDTPSDPGDLILLSNGTVQVAVAYRFLMCVKSWFWNDGMYLMNNHMVVFAPTHDNKINAVMMGFLVDFYTDYALPAPDYVPPKRGIPSQSIT